MKRVAIIILSAIFIAGMAEAQELEATAKQMQKANELQGELLAPVMEILASKCPKYKEAFESKTDISSLMTLDAASLEASGVTDSAEFKEAQQCISNALQSPEFQKLVEGISLAGTD